MTCARCGKANREGARFCDGCGAALVPQSTAVEARKTVTIVFADLIGSTSLHERLDPESVRRVMDHYYRAVRAPIEAHGGTVVQLLGDGVMCAFGVPVVAEDDAIRAVRAAVGMQQAFREFARKERDVVGDVGLRVAVNTGEVVVTDEHAAGIGDPLNVAARLQQEARDGDVLISESTERLVRELVTLEPVGTFSLRGRAEGVRAFRVLSLERPTGAAAVAFVGRDDELRRLLAVYDSAVRAPGTRLATILGSPGVGKSRLLAELARRLVARSTMLSARCDAAGGGTFAPVADALREHLRLPAGAGRDAVRAAVETLLPGEESPRVATGIAALLAGTPAPPEETFFVVRRLLAAVAASQPVVLTIDDVQWAEPLLLDLIEHLVQWGAGTPLLILVAARPELRDARSSLANPGDLVAAVVTLGGLDAGAATRLAANVIGAEELPAAIAGRVLATSEGNPLFVGELVRMLVHDGILRREGDRWTTGEALATFEMPPTIHALLAARIERLKPAERTILERAAVVGRHFSRGAVANLLPPDITDLDARLETLRRSELIEPDTGWLLGEPVMRFHHVLIRDAAYRRVLKGTRAELHARFADWLESRSGEAVEHDETLGWHLEQAHQNLRELGPVDAKGRALGERAARHLGAAGRRALARDDLPLAGSLLGRAIARLDPDDPARPDLALDWCEALLASGDVGPAAAAIDEVGRLAAGSARLRAWHACFVGQRAVMTDPQSLRATADSVAASAETLAAEGDAAGEAKAHSVQATALGRLGEFGAAEAALDRALAAARRARDRRRANAVLAGAPLAALWGPSPVTRASGRCLDVVRVLRITQGAPAVEAVALRCQAVLEALRGRTEAARRMIASSRRMVEELGITQRLLEADMFAGMIELLEGDAAAAERSLREAYEGLRRLGLRIDVAQAAALLGRALLAAGRAAEAETLSHESEALAGDDLKAAIAWRGVRAEALARCGEHDAAVTLARAAVDIAAATDALLDHADARLALAAALRAAGRTDEAAAEELRAIELWEAKGASLLAERARRAMGCPPAATVSTAPSRLDDPAGASEMPPRVTGAPSSARFTNAAVRAFDDFRNRILARDWDAVVASTAPNPIIDDRRRLVRLRVSGDDYFRHARIMFATTYTAIEGKLIATRGDRLALLHVHMEGDTRGVKAEENFLVVLEVDAQGRRERFVVMDEGDLDAARDELDLRHSAGEGAPHAEALANLRAFRLASEARDWDAVARLLPADFTLRSHRRLVGIASVIDRDEYLATRDRLQDLRLQGRMRVDHVLRLGPRAGAEVMTWYGTIDGGEFEDQFVHVYDHDGHRAHHAEIFDVDQLDAALARYEELERREASPFANAALVAIRRARDAWNARDWDRLASGIAPSFRCVERRRTIQLELDREQLLDFTRPLFDMGGRAVFDDLIATRGERLCLVHVRIVSEDGAVGPSEIESLSVVEVDETGRQVALVVFDPDDVDAAYAELDARYLAGEAAAYGPSLPELLTATLATRDLDGLRSVLSPGLVVHDHRPLGWETRRGPDAYIASLRGLVALAPDATIRFDHFTRSERGAIGVTTLHGTHEGGSFEDVRVFVSEIDAQEQLRRLEFYTVDQLDAARVRFAEIRAGTPRDPVAALLAPNAACVAIERARAAFHARDWDALRSQYHPSAKLADHRRHVMLADTTLDQQIADFMQAARDEAVWETGRLVAAIGERIAVQRFVMRGRVPPWEIEFLQLCEVDGAGRITALIAFDAEDWRGASRAAWNRWCATDAVAGRIGPTALAFQEAVNDRNRVGLEAVLSPDLVVHDHRRIPVSSMEADGLEAFVQGLSALWDLAADAHIQVVRGAVAYDNRGMVLVARTWGTLADGGSFESYYVNVAAIRGGRIYRFDMFEPEQTEGALACFATLPYDLLRIPPNAASRICDRWQAAFDRRDWAALEAEFAPAVEYDDRRRMTRLTGDRATLIASVRHTGSRSITRVSREVLTTAGDRLVLERYRWAGGDPGADFEVEGLCVTEVDAQDRVVAHVVFDLDDRRAASREMLERFVRSDAGRVLPAPSAEMLRALYDHDLERVRAVLTDDFYVDDHRRTGLGRIQGRDAYVAALAALFAEAPDVVVEPLYHLALEPHGMLAVAHTFGTLVGGGEFENVFVQVGCHGPEGIVCAEMFELADLDVARRRFEALRPTSELIPPNAASRASDLLRAAAFAGSAEGYRAVVSADFVYVDHTRNSLTSGGVEQAFRSTAYYLSLENARVDHMPVAALGDRVFVEHVKLWAGPPGGEVEGEGFGVIELDVDGRVVALAWFDVGDRRAALADAHARFASGEAARFAGQVPIAAVDEALQAHDYDRIRRFLAEDLVLRDYRRIGLFDGVSGEGWVDSLRVHADLAPDLYGELLAVVALNDHGRVDLHRITGTADGVAFENMVVRVIVTDGTLVRHLELFDPQDRARAIARFEELSAAASSAARAAG